MSVQTVVADFPAYRVVRPEPNAEGFTVLKDGDRLGFKAPRGYYHEYMIGSVVSYALKNGSDPIRALDRARSLGHDLHFIFPLGTMLTAHKRAQYDLVEVTTGMKVLFEGRRFEVHPTHNDNLRLKEV